MSDPVQEYLETILSGVCTKPVSIERKQDSLGVLFIITPDQEDAGKILGKDAETITAIRRLVRQKGYLHDQRVSLKVNVDRYENNNPRS